MNRRTREIINSLCHGEALTLNRLAETYGISTRTIRKDLDAIDTAMRAHGLAGIMLERGGVVACPDDPSVLLEAQEQHPGAFHLEQDDRIHIAAALAAAAGEGTTLGALAEQLLVSRGTVVNDLDAIKEVLVEHGLEPESRASKGFRAKGREYDRRRLILHAYRGATEGGQHFMEQSTDLLYPDGDTVEKVILQEQYALDQILTDVSEFDIYLYARITLIRIKQGCLVHASEGLDPGDSSPHLPLAHAIGESFGRYFHIRPIESEMRALALRLGHQYYARRSGKRVDAPAIQLMTRKFIDSVSHELGIDLTDDFTFFEKLSEHLDSVLQPVPVTYPASDMVFEIMASNESIVNAVRACDSCICEHAGRDLTDVEIGYIVMHVCAAIERKKSRLAPLRVAVACNSGVATSQLLSVRLQSRFNITVSATCTAHDAETLDPTKFDLIITTVPLKGPEIEWVLVSPLITDEEAKRVSAKLTSLRGRRNIAEPAASPAARSKNAAELVSRIAPTVYSIAPAQAPQLMRSITHIVSEYLNDTAPDAPGAGGTVKPLAAYEYLPPSHIRLNVRSDTWQDAVRESAAVLLKGGYIEERYVEAMLANIEENGPYVVLTPGFALPHEGIDAGTLVTGFSMIRLAEPVVFGEPDLDPVEFVCCLSATDHNTHLRAFFDLVNLMRRPEVRTELHAASTPEEFSAAIERLELAEPER